MSAITSNGTGGGNLSSGASWSGGVAPVANDTITVANGDVITVDQSITLGSNGSNVGHAFTVNGASTGSFGTLKVAAGVTLTLQGKDLTTNTMGLVNKFGKFLPQPGSIVLGDCASNFQSIILNKGRLEAVGTAQSRITFSCPAANVSWNNSVASEAISGSSWPYDPNNNVAVFALAAPWISNSGGTALGSAADSSLSWSSKTPSGILATEVASLALVNGTGKYFVNYDMGIVWFYHLTSDGNPSATAAYKKLSTGKGWGITANQNTSDHTLVFDYCDFLYMGTTTSADTRCLDVANKGSASVNADNRLFQLTNCTVSYCYRFLSLKASNGTLADPLLVTGNTFNTVQGDSTFGTCLATYRNSVTYVSYSNNVLNTGLQWLQFIAPFGSIATNTGITISGNTGTCQNFVAGALNTTTFPGSTISNNVLSGIGWCKDYRMIEGWGGTGGSQATITGNKFDFFKRSIHFCSYSDITKNEFGHSTHHVVSADVTDDVYVTTVNIQNNLVWGSAAASSPGNYGSPAFELGYNHRQWIDAVVVSGNTVVDDSAGFVGFGDCQDTAQVTLLTNVDVTNNIALMNSAGSSKAWQRPADGSTVVTRVGIRAFDYNLDFGFNTRNNGPNQGTFNLNGVTFNGLPVFYNTAAGRNITGVNVHSPSYTTTFTGKTLTYTVNSADADVTLAWDGGTAVQLIFSTNGTGTATAGANTTTNGVAGLSSGTITLSTAGWSTTKNNAGCPAGHWVKITGGTGVGQVRAITNNTATVLTVVPAWGTVPSTDSTFAIYKSEVTLTAGDASTVHVGVNAANLPATTQSDSIDFVVHALNSDPQLTAPNAQTNVATNYQWPTGSPAKNAGTTKGAPGDDFFGTARPQGSAYDVGFFEFPVTSSAAHNFRPREGIMGWRRGLAGR